MDSKTTAAQVFARIHQLVETAGYKVFKGRFVETSDVLGGAVVDVRVAQSGEVYGQRGPICTASLAIEVSWHGYIEHDAPDFSMFYEAEKLKRALGVPAAHQDCGSPLDPVRIIGQPTLNKISYLRPRTRQDYGVVTLQLTISYRS